MPRPTAAQLAYGSATVVCSTMVMLVLSQTRSVAGIASIALAGLALGLFVAVTVSGPRAVPAAARRAVDRTPVPRRTVSVPAPREHTARPRAGAGASPSSGHR
ncbi:hypothetical protein DMH02_008055 [Streptomyces sp. WAC 00631]|uniref:hypothetical protein n=1 Tax=Streptomyces TaxID=1883 RepID=UPI000F7B3CEF|nr:MULTISPECIES: hypothetical protein [Streptomyces]MCC5033173.1 hypothetical protein [Streptomyces sp. WAC 00631]WSQ71808.1 hypothetical protein OG463_10385 [Streptomyces xinghaiensis]